MNNSPEIAPASRVTLHFSLALIDGTEALSTFGEEPFSFVMGDGSLPEGLELALYGLRQGDEQTLQLTPEQAYGRHDDALVRQMPRGDFPEDMEPAAGQVIHFTTPAGEETAGRILEAGPDRVRVDFNHPLAGQELVFRVLVLKVESTANP